MLFIHPPVAKPCEPPAGIAQLAGALASHNIPCSVSDMNIESIYYLISQANSHPDTWTKRATKNRKRNIASLRSSELYSNTAKYNKTVLELNRLVEIQGGRKTTPSFANYHDTRLSPLKSSDLLKITEQPELCLYYPFLVEQLQKLLRKEKTEHIGISLNYLSQAFTSFALIGIIKKYSPASKIILGGGLVTSWMRGYTWNNPFDGLVDHCIDGCGEAPLLAIFGQQKQSEALPDYDSFPLQKYFAPGFILPYSSSSGCFWNKCSFCPERAEKNIFLPKSAEKVLAELDVLIEKYNPVLIQFLDTAIPPAILKHLAAKELSVPWYGFARITEHLLNLDFCRDLKKSGCVMLKLGIESGDQGVLDKMEKGLDLVHISAALKNLKAAGISTYVYLLFGTPEETIEGAYKTLEFTKAHHREIDFLNLAIFNMPINSGEKGSIKTSTFYEGDLSLYTDFVHPHGWNRKEVRLFLDRQFKRQPEIASILRRDPQIFTSNHAPFFCKG